MSGVLSNLTPLLEGWGQWLSDKAMAMINSWVPPEKRAELIEKLKAWTTKHPKVTAFLLTNITLSGLPLFLFILFGLTVFTFSLIVGLIVGLVIAVLFSLSAVGIALMFLFPIVFFTTLTACFVFLLGLGGYYIFKKFNDGKVGAPGEALGDKINQMTGGKLDYFMGQAREAKAENQLGDSQAVWSKGPSPLYGKEQAGPARTNGTKAKEMEMSESDEDEKPKKRSDSHSPNNNHSTPKKSTETNGTPKKAAESNKGTTSGFDPKSHATNATNGARKNVNADSVGNAANAAGKTANVGGATDKVKGAPKKLGNVQGTATGLAGNATGALG